VRREQHTLLLSLPVLCDFHDEVVFGLRHVVMLARTVSALSVAELVGSFSRREEVLAEKSPPEVLAEKSLPASPVQTSFILQNIHKVSYSAC